MDNDKFYVIYIAPQLKKKEKKKERDDSGSHLETEFQS